MRRNLLGAAIGLGLAVAVFGLSWLSELLGHSERLQTVVNFFASVPTLLLARTGLSAWSQGIIFLGYWSAIGGVLGLLLARRRMGSTMIASALLIALAVAHRAAQIKLERALDAALNALGQWLSGAMAP